MLMTISFYGRVLPKELWEGKLTEEAVTIRKREHLKVNGILLEPYDQVPVRK